MPSPVLNDDTFRKARNESDAGWASPIAYQAPVSDGPISDHRRYDDRMTIGGTMTAVGVLFALLLVGGAFGWASVTPAPAGTNVGGGLPGWLYFALFGALGLAIVTTFKPTIARFTSPGYAVLEGLVLGAISRVYNDVYPGIVLSAVGATVAVFAVMWFLYATRVIKVTDKFRRMVIAATMGVMLLYLVSFVIRIFGGSNPLLDGSGGASILVSVVVVGIAAFNLALDFDMIERGAAAGAPRYMEWYAGFGLMVTVVWLYLEILRLLAKLQDRR
jgi:uncharacterized YccA/Bax inhibitor family protein